MDLDVGGRGRLVILVDDLRRLPELAGKYDCVIKMAVWMIENHLVRKAAIL